MDDDLIGTPELTRIHTGEAKKRSNSGGLFKSNELALKDVLVRSPFAHENDPVKRSRLVIKEFNKGVTDFVLHEAGAFRVGQRVDPNEFLLAHKNKVPEIAIGDGKRLCLAITGPYTDSGIIGRFPQDAPIIGAYGSFIINVPLGHYGKGYSGSQPLLFGEGTHVIRDTLFRMEEKFASQSDNYISHGIIRILRVPIGYVAKIYSETTAIILGHRIEPYVFRSAMFSFDPVRDFVSQLEPYINHGTQHMIRVPAGNIAKVWLGSEPMLLEFRKEVYTYNDSTFRLERATNGNLFEKSDAKLIQHGAIKRIIPPLNEVAITNKDGKLEIIDVSAILSSPTHSVVGFLNTGIQTLEFPSSHTKKQRREEDKTVSLDAINYEVFMTKDSLKVGVKLLVAYKISNPLIALTELRTAEGIIRHIEGVVTADMGRTIQQCSSQEFLSSAQSRPQIIEEDGLSAPRSESYQDLVKRQLAVDLKEYGIDLIRMSVQESKILDSDVANKMSQQALVTARASADQAALDTTYLIARKQATQEAEVKQIAQKQANESKINQAQAELEASKLRAQAELESAKLRADALRIESKAKNDVASLEGELLEKYPRLFELKLAQLRLNGLEKSEFTVVSPEFSDTFMKMGGGGMFSRPGGGGGGSSGGGSSSSFGGGGSSSFGGGSSSSSSSSGFGGGSSGFTLVAPPVRRG